MPAKPVSERLQIIIYHLGGTSTKRMLESRAAVRMWQRRRLIAAVLTLAVAAIAVTLAGR